MTTVLWLKLQAMLLVQPTEHKCQGCCRSLAICDYIMISTGVRVLLSLWRLIGDWFMLIPLLIKMKQPEMEYPIIETELKGTDENVDQSSPPKSKDGKS